MTAWSWLRPVAGLWLIRMAIKVTRWLLLAVIVIVAWPLTLIVLAGYVLGWRRGWPPVRLLRAAAWALTGTAASLLVQVVHHQAWQTAALTAGRWWAYGRPPHPAAQSVLASARAFVLLASATLPAGLGLAAAVWAWRKNAITTGRGGFTASAPITFDGRQWRWQVSTAKELIKAPGAVPLLARGGKIPVGGTIRTVGHHWDPVFSLPAEACARHMVIVGATGSGKTNLMIRLWAGWFTATLGAYRAGRGNRPLLVVLDCKGGRDARRKADRTRRLLYAAGTRHVMIWPDDAALSLWALPAQDLAVLLYQMIETGTGSAAYYADIMQAVLTLAVTAPGGPPLNATAFLDRLDAKWLARAWSDGRHPREAALVHSAARHLPDIQIRYATLLERLGPALDGPGTLADADAWYFILEGTREPSVAQAQAMALTELAAHAATDQFGEPRAILLAADDYSAVSGRVPLSNLYERGRSLGIGVQVSAQSWQGLGRDEDERYRIAATADGGIFVMQTPYPEPLTQLAGTRRVLETTRNLIGHRWGRGGTARIQRASTADPDLIRRLDIGQACYIHRGAATFVQVARPKPSPLSLLPPPASPVSQPSPAQDEPAPAPWPMTRDLDDILGPADGPVKRNPFAVLGVPERSNLDDETVRAAWRAIAAATHPDRADGGDLARYTQASAAYAELVTPWSRSEAYADLIEQAWPEGRFDDHPDGTDPGTEPLPAVPAAAPLHPWPPSPLRLLLTVAWIPSRIRRGRPLRLLIRADLAAGLSLAVLAVVPGQPMAVADVATLITWFLVTGRKDLAPPPER